MATRQETSRGPNGRALIPDKVSPSPYTAFGRSNVGKDDMLYIPPQYLAQPPPPAAVGPVYSEPSFGAAVCAPEDAFSSFLPAASIATAMPIKAEASAPMESSWPQDFYPGDYRHMPYHDTVMPVVQALAQPPSSKRAKRKVPIENCSTSRSLSAESPEGKRPKLSTHAQRPARPYDDAPRRPPPAKTPGPLSHPSQYSLSPPPSTSSVFTPQFSELSAPASSLLQLGPQDWPEIRQPSGSHPEVQASFPDPFVTTSTLMGVSSPLHGLRGTAH